MLGSGYIYHTALGKRLGYGPAGLEPPDGAQNSKKTPSPSFLKIVRGGIWVLDKQNIRLYQVSCLIVCFY